MQPYRVEDNIRAMMSIYYGMVKEVDDNIGRLLRRLDAYGLTANTLVIFTADHGEMLGEHGMHGKACFYEGSVRIPLVMRLPGVIRAGTVVDTPVAQADYCPTILDLLGAPRPPAIDGRSLRPLLEGQSGYPDFAVSEWNPVSPNLMVRTREWKLMMANKADARATDALYHLKEDPGETRNLLAPADRAAYRKPAQEMRERLVAWCEHVRAPYTGEIKRRQL
jgi:arylsulfatase A-like enzyme